jgi:hypothetical protein
MQRLRTLQLRLNSVDPAAAKEATERVLEWRACLGETKARENRRRRLYAYVTDSAKETIEDFRDGLGSRFPERLSSAFDSLLPELRNLAEWTLASVAESLEADYGGRLGTLEKRGAAADEQLAELRSTCLGTYVKFSEANARLDQIWENDEVEGVGGWRAMTRKLRAEKEASEKTPLEVFREESFSEVRPLEARGFVGATCPVCGEQTGKRKARSNLVDDLVGMVGVHPYKCSRCMVRFYRFRPGRRRKTSV